MIKTKEYLTDDELITTIQKKGIAINDFEKVNKILATNNYYVIMGYKNLFLNPNGKYISGVSFENIYELYIFDRELKLLLLNSLLDIENIIKVAITKQFCSKYGFKEDSYLDKNNYNTNHKYLEKTFKILEKQLEERSNENLAVMYYKEKYGFVPFWVASKVLSFGVIKEIYAIMKDEDKIAIKNSISNFEDMKIKNLFTSMQLLVDMRNKTAHDEIVYNHKHRKILLSKTKEHKKINLIGNNGLNDMLGVLISMKNILPYQNFNQLIDSISLLINKYISSNNIISKSRLLYEMGLPDDFELLKW